MVAVTTKDRVPFKVLSGGDCFDHDRRVYVKLATPDRDGALDVQTGARTVFDPEIPVVFHPYAILQLNGRS